MKNSLGISSVNARKGNTNFGGVVYVPWLIFCACSLNSPENLEELLRLLSSRLRNSHPEELSNLLRASSCPEGTGILGRELSNEHVEMKEATGNGVVRLSIVTHTYKPSTRETEGIRLPWVWYLWAI